MMRTLGFITVLSLLLGACASAPETHYYRLPSAGLQLLNSEKQKIQLNLSLPGFLNSSSMAYQTNDVSLDFSRHNLWAQPPREGISESLANHLNLFQSKAQFVLNAQGKTSQSLNVTINNFNGRFDGQVEVSGYAIWQDVSGNTIKTQNFTALVPQSGDGYSAMVTALDEALLQVAQTIASQAPKL